eukprot:5021105-Heterocapsa_arctica.AAC.1
MAGMPILLAAKITCAVLAPEGGRTARMRATSTCSVGRPHRSSCTSRMPPGLAAHRANKFRSTTRRDTEAA